MTGDVESFMLYKEMDQQRMMHNADPMDVITSQSDMMDAEDILN